PDPIEHANPPLGKSRRSYRVNTRRSRLGSVDSDNFEIPIPKFPKSEFRTPQMPLDPVCGMTVDASTPLRAEYRGITYYFCSRGCLDKFKATPERYLDARTPEPMEVADRTYTCPMHPEVRQRGPGACPICGMALEPAMVSLEEAPN